MAGDTSSDTTEKERRKTAREGGVREAVAGREGPRLGVKRNNSPLPVKNNGTQGWKTLKLRPDERIFNIKRQSRSLV